MRSRVRWAAVLVASLIGGGAAATTVVYQDVPTLSRGADAIIRGTVVKTESRWSSDKRRIFTVVEVDVADTLKGGPAGRITLRQPGGVVGDIGQRVDGLATFQKGEEVVLFLERRPDDSFVVAGLAQGKFRVERSSDGKAAFAIPEHVAELRIVDPATRAELHVKSQPVPLEELELTIRKAIIVSTDPAKQPTSPKTPKVQQAPERP